MHPITWGLEPSRIEPFTRPRPRRRDPPQLAARLQKQANGSTNCCHKSSPMLSFLASPAPLGAPFHPSPHLHQNRPIPLPAKRLVEKPIRDEGALAHGPTAAARWIAEPATTRANPAVATRPQLNPLVEPSVLTPLRESGVGRRRRRSVKDGASGQQVSGGVAHLGTLAGEGLLCNPLGDRRTEQGARQEFRDLRGATRDHM